MQSQIQALSHAVEPERAKCIVVEDLVKSYKRGRVRALDGLSLDIYEGEIFGLIGPNGAGKSTLMGCLLGLLKPESGSISILGMPPGFLSTRRMTGYAPERPDFEGWMTARQFLEYHHMLAGRDRTSREREIDSLLTRVALASNVWDRRISTYSRGMLQRLNIAQMLLGEPRLLLLDEPTLGLDPLGVVQVRKVLMELRQSGVTAIINSHQLDEIERLCDRVAFIRDGKICSVQHLNADRSEEYTLKVRWNKDRASENVGEAIAAAAGAAGVCLKELTHSSASFLLTSESAHNILRELISRGVMIEEAVPERTRLEQLFEIGGQDE
jgi:ABC-2 type transport system ATP-binding protein